MNVHFKGVPPRIRVFLVQLYRTKNKNKNLSERKTKKKQPCQCASRTRANKGYGARIVDEYVELSEARKYRLDHALDALHIAHIGSVH